MHVNLASSPDGRAITGKQRTAQRSYHVGGGMAPENIAVAPALAVSGGRLYPAWTGGDYALNLLAAEHPADAAPVTLKEPSLDSPSLMTAGDDNLMLAWTGRGFHVTLLTLAADSSGVLVPLEDTKTQFEKAKSYHAPALCSHRGSLIIAWSGTDHHLDVARLR